MLIGIEKKEALQPRGLPKFLEIMLELLDFNARHGSMKSPRMAMAPIKKHHTTTQSVLCETYTEESSFHAAELSVMAMQHYEMFSVTALRVEGIQK